MPTAEAKFGVNEHVSKTCLDTIHKQTSALHDAVKLALNMQLRMFRPMVFEFDCHLLFVGNVRA
jgi:hypothetical protein